MKIDENTPYIVVDNRKIAPIQRLSPAPPVSHGRKQTEERPFGVVDRVTISSAAREKLRQMESMGGEAPATLPAPADQTGNRAIPFLSAPPKQRP